MAESTDDSQLSTNSTALPIPCARDRHRKAETASPSLGRFGEHSA
ncbi:MAG: hypothetical protein PHS57_03720 [Alphaproteobacteria bacterium]|nr:hypothetical protein [Alphaproteobacteria bacterium]